MHQIVSGIGILSNLALFGNNMYLLFTEELRVFAIFMISGAINGGCCILYCSHFCDISRDQRKASEDWCFMCLLMNFFILLLSVFSVSESNLAIKSLCFGNVGVTAFAGIVIATRNLFSCKRCHYIRLSSQGECSICLEVIGESGCQTLTCKHSFHVVCLEKWLTTNESCPNCRAEL